MSKKRALFKFTLLAILGALGVVLMSYIQFPYPFAPFLIIEISDFVIILTFLLFGLKEAIIVTLVKTLGDLMFRGPVGPYGVGQITAFIASMTYCLGMWIVSKLVKKERIGFRILGYASIVLIVTTVMTIANYFVLTPIFLGQFSFLDMTNDSLAQMTGINSYLLSIIALYVPFNLMKGTMVVTVAATAGMAILKIYQKKLGDSSEHKEFKEPTEGTDL